VADPARRAAVLGRPIAHSLSPVLHTAAYAALGLNWTYEAIDCGANDLAQVLAERGGWAGFSCTMPLKRALLEIADEVRPVAAMVGAGNTLLPRVGGGWIADNTDVSGIVDTIREAQLTPGTVTVLGAGGTAQALLAALVDLGVPACTALVRDSARTGALRATAHALGVEITIAALDVQAPALGAELVVSTLPGDAGDAFAAFGWTSTQALLDVVYDPWPTPLASAATRAGATVLSGARMLLHQAGAQVELMTGQPAPTHAMDEALRRRLGT
jgi:shikimate dehydrogenase